MLSMVYLVCWTQLFHKIDHLGNRRLQRKGVMLKKLFPRETISFVLPRILLSIEWLYSTQCNLTFLSIHSSQVNTENWSLTTSGEWWPEDPAENNLDLIVLHQSVMCTVLRYWFIDLFQPNRILSVVLINHFLVAFRLLYATSKKH